ncbi:NAD(P)-dependent oxidoreductase [Altererythrobacter sp. BO-6]|uniref:NAD-dependent epimerase/dehydratase family protein n=1 Tax=Altererythrobacter sp. BO-6 TaxID=2604537 RepID=UPI0013E1820A|nr:NAD(P)-dependent oxidoreductase [Altererythrobacter sp. BO-6]QIG53194.1 NAD(P)-dependent oxidoreductase [Altererythrobacter sp. BO-6]
MARDLVAVTGASGFVGHAVLRALQSRDVDVLAIGTQAGISDPSAVPWHSVDLLEKGSARKLFAEYRPRALIHAAWARSKGAGLWHLQENLAWRDASLALFREYWDETGGHIVGCGTCAEYDAPSESDCIEDETPISPASIYGRAKAELAEQAHIQADRAGGSLSWARLFYMYGPYENPERLVPQLLDRMLKGEVAKTASGRAIRDFGYSGDMGEALVDLAVTGSSGTFNVATGKGVSIASLAKRASELCGREDLLEIGALADRMDEPPRIVADVTKLKSATGWSPVHDLDSGLKSTIDWRSGIAKG